MLWGRPLLAVSDIVEIVPCRWGLDNKILRPITSPWNDGMMRCRPIRAFLDIIYMEAYWYPVMLFCAHRRDYLTRPQGVVKPRAELLLRNFKPLMTWHFRGLV